MYIPEWAIVAAIIVGPYLLKKIGDAIDEERWQASPEAKQLEGQLHQRWVDEASRCSGPGPMEGP